MMLILVHGFDRQVYIEPSALDMPCVATIQKGLYPTCLLVIPSKQTTSLNEPNTNQ